MHKLKPRWENIIPCIIGLLMIISFVDIILSAPRPSYSIENGHHLCKGHVLKLCYIPNN